MSAADRLYEIQLRLKKNNVNNKRKTEEATSLRVSFETQIEAYLYSLYSSAVCIWVVLNTGKDDLSDQINQIKSGPHSCVNDSELCAKAQELMNADSLFEDFGKDPISLDKLLFTLSLYRFLWSAEAVDAFMERLMRQTPEVISNAALCLVLHPLTQVYFVTVLTKAFRCLSDANLKEFLLKTLRDYAHLVPGFLRMFLKAVPEKNVVFWTRFLKPILENFAVFGVDIPDILLYEEETLEALVKDLDAYFSEPESVEFVNAIVECKIDVTIVPSEMELKRVDCNYQSVTIVDRDCEGFHSSEVPLFYMKCESGQETATNSSKEDGEQSRADVVKEFLLEAKLVRLERNYETAFQYFQEIADLSCTFNDPVLEIGLDKMSEFLDGSNPMSMDDLLTMVEQSIEEEENNKSEDPFASISQYSAQFGYITLLNARVAAITENAKTYVNFLRARRYMNGLQIDTSLPLVSEYIRIASTIGSVLGIPKPDDIIFRTVHSILTTQYNYDLQITDDDRQIHDFLEKEKDNLINLQPPEFIDIYKSDPAQLACFSRELQLGFSTRMPLARVSHIHTCYQSLTSILQMRGYRDIGADQLVPFAIIATVVANPMGLASTHKFLTEYVEPVLAKASPIGHAEEYSVIQFISTYQFLFATMKA